MPRIAAVATALPPHSFAQSEIRAACERVWSEQEDLRRLCAVFDRSGVERRHFAFPLDYYLAGPPFDVRNADFIREGTALAAKAARACLARAGVPADRVDHLFLVTTTGLATPSLDARLVETLGLRRDVRRWPLFGLGCAGGAGGLARAEAVLRDRPSERALVVSVELCGQIFSPRAQTPVDVIGAALFGDGAAAALVEGADPGAGARIRASHAVLFENTREVMGWNFTSDGMRLVLSREVPQVVLGPVREAVFDFLHRLEVPPTEVKYWILHPGGRRVIDTYLRAFGLSEPDVEWTRRSIARVGNLSSASVLFILADVMAGGAPRPGEKGLLCALGPGFGAEMLLIEG
ncbi:MAG: type III polyketide synthase [Planctomycetes bacterium]|nr:type III polyketide synthase [Planctomycetota bacterium]